MSGDYEITSYDAGYEAGFADARNTQSLPDVLDHDPHSEDDSLVWLLVRKTDAESLLQKEEK